MVICPVEVNEKSSQTIVIGRRGTYNTQEIVFDIGYLIDAYGAGTAVLAIKRSQDSSAYPTVVTQKNTTLTWTVSETDTYYVGAGECQLMWYVDGGLAKTIIYPLVVMRDILSTSEEAPDAYQEWVDDLTALGAETLENAQNAAQSASDAESAKDDAIAAKEVAEEAAEIAQEAVVHAPIIQNGYWYIWSDGQYADTGVRAEGQKGDKGDTGEKGDTGNGIASITKTGTAGLVDTYTVTYTDGTTTTFTVTNGEKGDKGDTGATGNGIASIAKTGTSGNVDTYTITYTNGQTTTFTVTNGAVASVAGKTGAVTLDAGDVSFDGTQTYQAGTVGAELSNQKNAIDEIVLVQDTQPTEPANKIWVDPDDNDIEIPTMDEFTTLSNATSQLDGGTTGQLLRKSSNTDYDFEWSDVGQPTDTQVENAVDDWLTTHPEATTTVQDGSLTKSKFSDALKLETIKDYLTPEMYGAKGDGSTNDTQAIQDAIDAANARGGGIVLFSDKIYCCQGLTPKNNVTLHGCNNTTLKLIASPSDHLIYYYSDTVLENFNLVSLHLDGRSQTSYDLVHIEKVTLSPITYGWDKSIIDSCWISSGKVGVYCSIPGNVKINNTLIQANDIGIQQKHEHFYLNNTYLWANRIGADLYKANHFTWTNATFAHNTEYGITTDASLESALIGCSFIDNVVHFNGNVLSYRFIGCRFINAQKGIYGALKYCIVDGCYFSDLSVAGINLVTTDTYNNVITDNVFISCKEGIVATGHDQLIDGNQFRVIERAGIDVTGTNSGVLGVQITNNQMLDCSTEGLNLYPGILIAAPNMVAFSISGNLVRNSGTGKASYAIEMDATFTTTEDVLISNNVCRNMKTAGYKLRNNAGVTQVNNIGTVVTF